MTEPTQADKAEAKRIRALYEYAVVYGVLGRAEEDTAKALAAARDEGRAECKAQVETAERCYRIASGGHINVVLDLMRVKRAYDACAEILAEHAKDKIPEQFWDGFRVLSKYVTPDEYAGNLDAAARAKVEEYRNLLKRVQELEAALAAKGGA